MPPQHAFFFSQKSRKFPQTSSPLRNQVHIHQARQRKPLNQRITYSRMAQLATVPERALYRARVDETELCSWEGEGKYSP